MDLFQKTLHAHDATLERTRPKVLQLNVGKLCNLSCIHCHVSAGPRRKEIISTETLNKILDWFEDSGIQALDLTGGAPEMIPDFKSLVSRVRSFDQERGIIDRCNLTILLEPDFEWLAEFLAENRVEIVASMPCYSPENVEEQRGHGVFDKSIEALQQLNRLGYGLPHSDLKLHLVYNPNGAFLPPEQAALEADYKREMRKHYGIEFHSLYALSNLPVARFAKYLKRSDEYERYMQLLIDAFNPSTIRGLMCQDTLNVSWEGRIYDCDFNQMMHMPILNSEGESQYLWNTNVDAISRGRIRTAPHCFGCTAGSGSSCGGSLTDTATSLHTQTPNDDVTHLSR